MGTNQAAVAGHNATKHLNEHAMREKQLRDREAALVAKEMTLNGDMGGNVAGQTAGNGVMVSLCEV